MNRKKKKKISKTALKKQRKLERAAEEIYQSKQYKLALASIGILHSELFWINT